MLLLEKMREQGNADPLLNLLLACPEVVHCGKTVRGAWACWLLFFLGERSGLVVLRVLRKDPVWGRRFQLLLPLSAVRNRDQMDVLSMLQVSQPQVRSLLDLVNSVVITLCPERFKLWTGNKVGTLISPVDVAIGPHGFVYVVDAAGKLFQVRLHYPADVGLLAGDLQAPSAVTYRAGVVFVTEKATKQIRYLVTGKFVFLRVSKMVVADIRAKLVAENVLTEEDAANMLKPELSDLLSDWLDSQSAELVEQDPQSQGDSSSDSRVRVFKVKKRRMEVLTLPGDGFGSGTPTALCASKLPTDHICDLFVSTDEAKIHEIRVTINGKIVRGDFLCVFQCAPHVNITALDVYVAQRGHQNIIFCDSRPAGGVYKLDLADQSIVCIVRNSTAELAMAHGVACDDQGGVFVTDICSRQVKKISLSGPRTVHVVAGTGERGNVDGGAITSSMFAQPAGLTVEYGGTVFVTDAAGGSLRMLTGTKGASKYLEMLYLLLITFGVWPKGMKGPKPPDCPLNEAVANLEKVLAFFQKAAEDIQTASGISVKPQGPQGAISTATLQSLTMVLGTLKSLQKIVQQINPNYAKVIKLKATLSLVVEHFHSVMRTAHQSLAMTTLQMARSFQDGVLEIVKSMHSTAFLYFTSRKTSFYPVPEFSSSFEELEKDFLPQKSLPAALSKEEEAVMRAWCAEIGASARCQAPRQSTTMERAGTAAPAVYESAKAPALGGDFLFETTRPVAQHKLAPRVLFEKTDCLVVLRKIVEAGNGFYLAFAVENVIEDDHVPDFAAHLFLPSAGNPLRFVSGSTVMLLKASVFQVLPALTFKKKNLLLLKTVISRLECVELEAETYDRLSIEIDSEDNEFNEQEKEGEEEEEDCIYVHT
jgi:hypothetical protein